MKLKQKSFRATISINEEEAKVLRELMGKVFGSRDTCPGRRVCAELYDLLNNIISKPEKIDEYFIVDGGKILAMSKE